MALAVVGTPVLLGPFSADPVNSNTITIPAMVNGRAYLGVHNGDGNNVVDTLSLSGVAGTRVGSKVTPSTNTHGTEVWEVIAPPSGTGRNITIDFLPGAAETFVTIVFVEDTGGVRAGSIVSDGLATAPNPISLSVPSAVGDLVLDFWISNATTATTAGAGQTVLRNTNNSDDCGASHEAGAATVTMSWDTSAWPSVAYSHFAFSLTPYSTGGVTLVVQDAAHGLISDESALVQHNVLNAADAVHGYQSETPALSQKNTLAVANAVHGTTSDAPVLLAHYLLSVQDASHALSSEAPTLTPAGALAIQDARHTHTVDNAVLTQRNILVVADVLHGVTSDTPALQIAFSLAVADANHFHTADAPDLVQHNLLVVQDVHHSLLTSNVSLSEAALLVVNDAHHLLYSGIVWALPYVIIEGDVFVMTELAGDVFVGGDIEGVVEV